MTIHTADTIDSLTDELRAFCDREGLPQECAQELLVGVTLTQSQRQWLAAFIKRWDNINQPQADWSCDDGESQ